MPSFEESARAAADRRRRRVRLVARRAADLLPPGLPRAVEAFACDLDGTLIGRDAVLRPRTRAAIRARGTRGSPSSWRPAGCSGRSRRTSRTPGSTSRSSATRAPRWSTRARATFLLHEPLELEVAREAIAALQALGLSPNVYVDDQLYVAEETEYSRAYSGFQHLPVTEVGDLLAWLERPPTKLVAVAEPHALAAVRGELDARFDGRVFMTTSLPYLLELGNPAVTKGSGLAFVAAGLGLDPSERRRLRRRRERRRAARGRGLRRRRRGRAPAPPGGRRRDVPRARGGGRRGGDRGIPRLSGVIDLKAARANPTPSGPRSPARVPPRRSTGCSRRTSAGARSCRASTSSAARTKLKGKPTPEQLEELQQVKAELKAAEDELAAAEAERDALALRVPNPPHDDVPDGATEDDVREVRRVGEPPALDGAARAPRGRALRHGAGGAHVRLALRLLGRRHRAAGARAVPVRARPARREGLRHRPAARARPGGARSSAPARSPPTRRTSTSSPPTSCTSPAPRRSRSRASTRRRSSPPTSCRSGTSPSRRASVARRARRDATRAG